MYDFTVCGAGPVGSYLAWKLSERGQSVLVLEEHKQIGEPLACSGLVSRNIKDFMPRSFFQKSSSKNGIIEREIKGARVHLGKKTYTFNSDQAFVVNRTRMDKLLAKQAIKSGANFSTESRLFGFFESKNKVSLYVKSKGFSNIRTKILAGCDGPLSIVRDNMNISQPNLLHGIFCYVDEEPDSYVDLYYKKAPGFFAWRIPRKDKVEYGLACKTNAKKHFQKFSKTMRLRHSKVYSGLIPYGLLPRTTTNRTFLCGDAAAQTKPYSGGGLIYGLTAADVASSLIRPDEPNMNSYEREWRNRLGFEIRCGLWMKRSYNLPAPFLNMAVKRLFSRHKKRDMQMDRPSTMW